MLVRGNACLERRAAIDSTGIMAAPVVDLNSAGIRAVYTDQISRAILTGHAAAVGDRSAHGIVRALGATALADDSHRAVTDTVDAAVGAADQNADRLIAHADASACHVQCAIRHADACAALHDHPGIARAIASANDKRIRCDRHAGLIRQCADGGVFAGDRNGRTGTFQPTRIDQRDTARAGRAPRS